MVAPTPGPGVERGLPHRMPYRVADTQSARLLQQVSLPLSTTTAVSVGR